MTTSADGGSRVALFQQPGAAIAQGAYNGNAQVGGSHKVMNAYEFLDAPGEFYFDKTSRTLYYYKANTENMTTARVVAPNNVATVLRVAGTSTSNHARNITFSGLTVQHSDWNLFNVAGVDCASRTVTIGMRSSGMPSGKRRPARIATLNISVVVHAPTCWRAPAASCAPSERRRAPSRSTCESRRRAPASNRSASRARRAPSGPRYSAGCPTA